MEKIKYLLILIIVMLFITGCNKEIFDTSYSFDKIICNYDGIKFELNVDSWNDYEGEQLQIKSDDKTYLLSANKCYMIGD